MPVYIGQKTVDKIADHAEDTYPDECCGFFFGKGGENRHIYRSYRVDNSKEGDQRRRFQISPKDYKEAEQFALDNDLDLLGVYHSHPDHPAEPSEHDRSVAMPWFSYIIVSVRDEEAVDVRSWRLDEERQFKEEKLAFKNLESEGS